MSGWARKRFEKAKEKATHAVVPLDEYDSAILNSTKELCKQLNIPLSNYNPSMIYWADYANLAWRIVVPATMADCAALDPSLITLQHDLKGNLDPAEWKSLIASELLYKYTIKPKYRFRLITHIVLPVTILLGLLIILATGLAFAFLFQSHLAGTTDSEALLALIILVVFLISAGTIVVTRLSLPTEKKARQDADKRAADLIGRDTLLRALRTAERFQPSSEESERLRMFRVNPLTPQERIANLTALPS